MGAGGYPDIAQKAAEASRPELQLALEGADVVFLVSGMGGGTGTGASPVVAEIARKEGAIVIGIVTYPFRIEKARLEKAKRQEESGKHTAKHEVEVPDEDVIFPVNDDNKVDISEVIRQELILNMPEKPLCSKDCKGFSEGKKEKKIDPRLEKLKELF